MTKKAKIIAQLIKEKGYSRRAFAEEIGIPATTLQSMLARGIGGASVDNVIKVCKALGITVEELEKMAAEYKFEPDNRDLIREERAEYYVTSTETHMLPIVGCISCGNGVLAYEDIEGHEPTPKEWVSSGEHFYLRAKGDSMIGARIYDGDLLLIRKQPEVENGEIAAVLIGGEEVVLKRVYFNGKQLILQSENPSYPPILAPPTEVKIIGKLKKIVINV
ncbi:LexA family protein [Desulfofalx alkaliphila]|uniref:LexA family protein n=1 Tax=Desulfofalx alkaliphila TaxID=105483 RepID=UPI0004E15B68|nr:LexA family transcriptional regulator [Desulfofalx alkaliphila]